MTNTEFKAYIASLAAPKGSTAGLMSRRARETAPRWVVRTKDGAGRWAARYTCLTADAADRRRDQLVAAGATVEVVEPIQREAARA